jgi:hypothetical protein
MANAGVAEYNSEARKELAMAIGPHEFSLEIQMSADERLHVPAYR